MISPILNALPTIHATLIGIGGGLFSAFALFAYTKLQESKDKLEQVLKNMEEISTPNSYIGARDPSLWLQNGELEWDDKAKNIVWNATSYYLDSEEKSGTLRSTSFDEELLGPGFFRMIERTEGISESEWREAREKERNDAIVSACRDLCQMLYFLFVSYPFTGRLVVSTPGVTELVEEQKQKPFDKIRLRMIQERIFFLSYIWESSKLALLKLATVCSEIEQNKYLQEMTAHHEERMAFFNANEDQRMQQWEMVLQSVSAREIDYKRIIIEYFDKIQAYEKKVIPALKEALNTDDLYNERFKLKQNTLKAVKLTGAILFFGVVVPLLLQSIQVDFGLVWSSWLDYFLLFITMVPYFWICVHLYKFVHRMAFK